MTLLLKVVPCSLNFGVRLVHNAPNLVALHRRQLQHPRHQLKWPLAGQW
jgi:hypothetical protein